MPFPAAGASLTACAETQEARGPAIPSLHWRAEFRKALPHLHFGPHPVVFLTVSGPQLYPLILVLHVLFIHIICSSL